MGDVAQVYFKGYDVIVELADASRVPAASSTSWSFVELLANGVSQTASGESAKVSSSVYVDGEKRSNSSLLLPVKAVDSVPDDLVSQHQCVTSLRGACWRRVASHSALEKDSRSGPEFISMIDMCMSAPCTTGGVRTCPRGKHQEPVTLNYHRSMRKVTV